MKKKLAYIGTAFMFPALAFAQIDNVQELGRFIIDDMINGVAVPMVFAIAFLVFIIGIFQYFIQGGHDEEAKDKGKSLMIWGLIGFFVMVSVWGLVKILTGTFETDNDPIDVPSAGGIR
jgi:NADH:ubiquinone oxidoreductase subunit 2 (subunit N)